MFWVITFLILLYILIIRINNKKIILKSLILGLLFGIISYNLVPRETYDILSHQSVVLSFIRNGSIDNLKYMLTYNELEFLPIIYSYVVSFTNNINLTQFFIVTLGYSIIFYLVVDYASNNQLKKIYSVPIMLFTIFGFYAINFMSGLYFYIGIIVFALAFYLDYYKESNKIFVYILYIIAILTHDTLLFPTALLIIFKLSNNKLDIKAIILVALLIPFSYTLLTYVYNSYRLSFLAPIIKIYTAYLGNGLKMKRFYSGYVYLIEMSKLIYTSIMVILTRKEKSIAKINNYLLILIASTIMMMTKSIVMIRFVMLIQFIGVVPTIKYFKINKKNIIMYFIMIILMVFYIMYFFHVMGEQQYNFLF